MVAKLAPHRRHGENSRFFWVGDDERGVELAGFVVAAMANRMAVVVVFESDSIGTRENFDLAAVVRAGCRIEMLLRITAR